MACLGGATSILAARGGRAISNELDFDGETRRVDALTAQRDTFKVSIEGYK
jgi:hypothetical protein